ncbi:F-type H+-transporting ATPase subunit epsilon [Nitrosomonas eutropha]|uniref:ATPase n=1 Tax=Nitrosomonas TaxID=914 RepID=UPI00088DED25|nr:MULTISPECIES: ATPase [Nitrosomonas]MXS80670.1 ATPase [Nitrosomonas sp. GH22]SCX11535.1 F-type H+-transporting ATPase subunit epsilon [Nitrosomonas eutropha]SDW72245.1 F-type H+-transporting ATPase subunit epsilon [Nitrosomonas eutropha]
MSQAEVMHVNLHLPTRLLFGCEAKQVFAEAENGAFAMLPNHTDFVAALLPSVLVITDAEGVELFFGIDQGVLVKHGHQVDIAVRRAVQSEDLVNLNNIIQTTFIEVDENERVARTALSRLEAGIVRRFSDLRKPLT